MPSALMIHPGECNRAERLSQRTGQPIKHTPRGRAAMGSRVAAHLVEHDRHAEHQAVRDDRYVRIGSTAVVLIDGPIWFDHQGYDWWGGESTLALANLFDELRLDDSIESVLLDMDSPGGTVAGVDDLITAITALSAAKPTAAFLHEMAASLAYWLASCTSTIYATPSSVSGAIGAMSVWYDSTAAAAKDGETALLFTSDAPHKGMGHWGVPITDEMAASEQAIIDAMGAMFRGTVTANRPLTEEAVLAMAGATYFGQSQLDRGLVDEIVKTGELYDRLLDGALFTPSASTASPTPSTPPAAHAASAAAATERRTAMDDTLKEQITALTDDEKKEVLALVSPAEEEITEETEEEKAAKLEEEEQAAAAAKASAEEKDEPTAMSIAQAKAFIRESDVDDENIINRLACLAVEKRLSETQLLREVIKAEKGIDPELKHQAKGNDAIGGGRGAGGSGGGGNATAKYHAAVKNAMDTFQISKHQATLKVNREQGDVRDAYVAEMNIGRVG